jgi:hypothetical protein
MIILVLSVVTICDTFSALLSLSKIVILLRDFYLPETLVTRL